MAGDALSRDLQLAVVARQTKLNSYYKSRLVSRLCKQPMKLVASTATQPQQLQRVPARPTAVDGYQTGGLAAVDDGHQRPAVRRAVGSCFDGTPNQESDRKKENLLRHFSPPDLCNHRTCLLYRLYASFAPAVRVFALAVRVFAPAVRVFQLLLRVAWRISAAGLSAGTVRYRQFQVERCADNELDLSTLTTWFYNQPSIESIQVGRVYRPNWKSNFRRAGIN